MSRCLPGRYQLSFRANVSDVSIPFPAHMHSPHWQRYNSLGDRTKDITVPLFILCPPLKDSIMCNPMPRQTPQAWTHSPLFPTTKKTALLFSHRLMPAFFFFFKNPPTYHGWYGQDGVIDLSKASCQRIAFGNQMILLSCSRQHVPWSGIRPAIIRNSRDRIACNVMLCPWQPRRGGLIDVFEETFSALFSKWSTVETYCFNCH